MSRGLPISRPSPGAAFFCRKARRQRSCRSSISRRAKRWTARPSRIACTSSVQRWWAPTAARANICRCWSSGRSRSGARPSRRPASPRTDHRHSIANIRLCPSGSPAAFVVGASHLLRRDLLTHLDRQPRYQNAPPDGNGLARDYCLIYYAIHRDDIEFRVFLANLERSLKFGRIAPTLKRLHAFPPKDHDRPLRQVSRKPRSWSCRDILATVIFDRFLRRRNVFFGVALLVAELVDGDHVNRRFGLRVQSLDGSAANDCPGQH